jgi:hypothetical protein
MDVCQRTHFWHGIAMIAENYARLLDLWRQTAAECLELGIISDSLRRKLQFHSERRMA